MPIDPSIALGVRPAQIDSPLNQMAKMYELQNAAQSNQLNKLKMDEYTRGVAEDAEIKNALTRLDKNSPTYEQDRFNAYALKGIEGVKAYAATKKEEAAAEEHVVGTAGKKLSNTEASVKLAKAAQNEILEYPSEAMVTSYYEDAKRKKLYDPETLSNIERFTNIVLSVPAPIDPATGEPDFTARRQAITRLQLEAKDRLSKNVSQQNVMVGGVPTTRELSIDPITGKATTIQGSTAPTYNKPAASTVVNVNNAQEKEFEKALGKGQADKVLASKASAEDAAQILATNMVGKTLLDKGMLTGVGANFFTTLNQGLSQAGIDFGYADAAQNSQAYGALMAANTAKIIKQFGAGTGLSDADREYALKAAAGDIKYDEKSIRKILDINNRAAQNAINKHNRDVKDIKTNIPLAVDVKDYTAGIPEGRVEASEKQSYKKVLDNLFPKSKE
jgi:hypothetical protein